MGAKFSPLLKAGWEVIPLKREDGKKPYVDGHHGADHAVADEATVRGWAKAFPTCNPGIVMPPGIIGLDVDNHDVDGMEALREFERLHGELPAGPRIFHGYVDGEPSPYGTRLFTFPPEVLDRFGPKMIVGNLNKVSGPGVDVIAPWLRYNVAPGAVHKSGEVYEWAFGDIVVPECKPTDAPMLTVKQAEALLTRRAKSSLGVKPLVPATTPTIAKGVKERGNELLRLTRELALLPEGESLLIEGEERGWQRGDGFFVLACGLVRAAQEAGKDLDAIKARFVREAHAEGHGLDEYEAERQWENALLSVEEDDEVPFVVRLDQDIEPYPVPAMGMPTEFTMEYLDRHHRNDDGVLMLRYNEGSYWLWEETPLGSYYRAIHDREMKSILTKHLRGASQCSGDEVERVIVRKGLKMELLDALSDLTLVSRHGAGELLTAKGGVPFINGWLDVETGALEEIGPERDVRWIVPAEYDETATCPEWFKFLDSIGFTEGTKERRLIQQWFGYLISGSCDIHKGMLLIGPKRGGKGTVLGVAAALLGDGAIGLQLDSFAKNFGLQNIIGKGLATVGDARFGFRTDKAIIENLLLLTSFEEMQFDVKMKEPVNTRPTARLMIASNEPPKWIEASDAISTRFVILEFTESFYGREDHGLKKRVLAELPGIARWALDGYRELLEIGHFTETEAGLKLQDQMIRDAAPVRVFVEEECAFGDDLWVESQKLFDRYMLWCERNNTYKMDKQSFFRDLNTAFPGVVHDLYKRIAGKQVRCKRGVSLL